MIFLFIRLFKNPGQVITELAFRSYAEISNLGSEVDPSAASVHREHNLVKTNMNGAEFLVKTLEAHGVTHVFGIPGAKVDSVFTALLDSPIELVLCRHEQNAAFMAQAFGRLTGRIGV